MLLELSIENFGIIRHVRWHPASRLNIITGETGAGKSLIIDAIEALVGKRVGEEVIKAGTDRTRIEGVFSVGENSSLAKFLTENELENEDTIILTREIERGKRTFTRVNRRPVTLRLLQEIGDLAIDIHGQSDHVSLNNPHQQLLLLDRYANARELRQEVENKIEKLYRLKTELEALSKDEREVKHRSELLSFQLNEIKEAKIQEGEDEALQKESTTLSNTENLKSLSLSAYQHLYESETSHPSAGDKIGEAIRCLKSLAQIDDSLNKFLREVESASYQIEDAARALMAYQDGLEYDPARLELVEQRLDTIRNLKRKYGNSITEVLQHADKAEEELNQLGFQNEKRAQLQKEYATLKKEIEVLCYKLSKIRHQSAEKLAKEIEKELGYLNMSHVGFRVFFSQFDTGDELTLPDGRTCAFTKSGVDKVEFLVSTNPGEPLKPLAKIASTGETSRLMLAIKSVLSTADATPTLIFDEIDVGIGGRSGEVVGRKLSALSNEHQVICITHLPQVAAFADVHFTVRKDILQNSTSGTIMELSDQDKLEEISAMLGSMSNPTLESAGELLEKAKEWKKNQHQ
ncbi:MAG: DNA repair protein RecN [Dehalococcoidia bacterium]|nr:DNA repair protein RecN [Dehalococcoidia bacterium]